MGLLDAPLLGAGEEAMRAAHADHALGVVGCAGRCRSVRSRSA
jgi:hypothetical protein